ncbi:MAG: DUF805 domain-containing protein [Thiotrichaceae bacterium]|nr:DUF805 domain-containing protein [Thiotrichaceae bacterium]
MSENPYAIPQSNLTLGSKEEDYGEIRFFSSKGRIGRLRYISYISTLILLGIIAAFVLMAFFGLGAKPYTSLRLHSDFLILLLPLFFVLISFFSLSIQRLHDVSRSGWLTILLLVPLLNVILVLALMGKAGAAERNDFGAPPPPNTLLVKVSSTLFILFWVLGQVSNLLRKYL